MGQVLNSNMAWGVWGGGGCHLSIFSGHEVKTEDPTHLVQLYTCGCMCLETLYVKYYFLRTMAPARHAEEKGVWDACMCRLIVHTAIESTYVGVF